MEPWVLPRNRPTQRAPSAEWNPWPTDRHVTGTDVCSLPRMINSSSLKSTWRLVQTLVTIFDKDLPDGRMERKEFVTNKIRKNMALFFSLSSSPLLYVAVFSDIFIWETAAFRECWKGRFAQHGAVAVEFFTPDLWLRRIAFYSIRGAELCKNPTCRPHTSDVASPHKLPQTLQEHSNCHRSAAAALKLPIYGIHRCLATLQVRWGILFICSSKNRSERVGPRGIYTCVYSMLYWDALLALSSICLLQSVWLSLYVLWNSLVNELKVDTAHIPMPCIT